MIYTKEMYLFGSYARGEGDEKSDLDFAVQDDGTKLMGTEFFWLRKNSKRFLALRLI